MRIITNGEERIETVRFGDGSEIDVALLNWEQEGEVTESLLADGKGEFSGAEYGRGIFRAAIRDFRGFGVKTHSGEKALVFPDDLDIVLGCLTRAEAVELRKVALQEKEAASADLGN